MSHFGHRVIGRKKASEEAEAVATRSNHFGPRVIGDVLAKRRLKARQDDGAKDSRSTPGKKKAKKEAAKKAAEETQEPEVVEAPTTTNLEDLEAALEGNAAFYEGLYSAELLRPSGPRKTALRMFLKFEMAHEDRDDRKAEIEAALN